MALPFIERTKKRWNAFLGRDPTNRGYGPGYSRRPDKPYVFNGRDKSIVNSIFNRIAIDCAQIVIKQVKMDDEGRYISDVDTELNTCLGLSANLDQTGRAFIQDVVQSMFDEGHVAIVPVDTDVNPRTGSYKIFSLRTGKIVQWYPKHVRVEVYREDAGRREEITVRKEDICIIENPLYEIVNERNSTLQRLIRKLALLDTIDEQTGSGKIDLIIQLPYSIRSEAKRKEAEKRRKDVEEQLTGSKYGIAYTDGTEKITQLNRPLENNLLKQIEYLTSQVFSQLGITEDILNGSANDQTMLNYYSRTIEPIMAAIADEMTRKFLTQTARSQHNKVMYFRDPFKLIPVDQLADLADKMTRNEIMSSNEIRQKIGMKPSDDPSADELRNKNLNQSSDSPTGATDDWRNMSISDIPHTNQNEIY